MSRLTLSFLLAVLTPLPVSSQSPQPQSPSQVQAVDGGTRQVLESIVIPPMANSPFVATLHTEWVQSLPGSGTITLVNDRRIARDSAGRIYQERWVLVPKNGSYKSHMNAIQISSPLDHTLYTCMMDSKKTCRLITYTPSTSTVYNLQGPPPGPLPDKSGYSTREALGPQLVLGMETLGTKENVILKPGAFGNDQEVILSREYWYSPQLGINLLSNRSDPRFGTQVFTVTDLSRSEPDLHLFELPEGFSVVDQRQSAPPAVD